MLPSRLFPHREDAIVVLRIANNNQVGWGGRPWVQMKRAGTRPAPTVCGAEFRIGGLAQTSLFEVCVAPKGHFKPVAQTLWF
jgi:hypothetical protein